MKNQPATTATATAIIITKTTTTNKLRTHGWANGSEHFQVSKNSNSVAYKINSLCFAYKSLAGTKKWTNQGKNQKRNGSIKHILAFYLQMKYALRTKRESFQFQSIVIPTMNLSKFSMHIHKSWNSIALSLVHPLFFPLASYDVYSIMYYVVCSISYEICGVVIIITRQKKSRTTTDNKTVADVHNAYANNDDLNPVEQYSAWQVSIHTQTHKYNARLQFVWLGLRLTFSISILVRYRN